MFRSLALLGLLSLEALASPTGKTSLQWQPCEIDIGLIYNPLVSVNYSCATLPVPLDYTNPQSASIPLQLIRVAATKAPFKGSVLFNPGGPGGSGIQDVAITGGLYKTILNNQYDLIGFDPRGTGKTIPFDCKAWSDNSANNASTRRGILPKRDMVEELYEWGWAASGYLADRCAETQAANGRFLSTAFVARDMLSIVDALQEDGMLRYWGLSYGTQLGNTFAAMFPDRIDRMFLDAVVNPHDYSYGSWLQALTDTDKVFLGFLDECVKAGPQLCQIANFSGPSTTASQLLELTNAMFEYLLEYDPIIGINQTSTSWDKGRPGTVYNNLKQIMFSLLYSPGSWDILAFYLQELLALDFSLFTRNGTATPPDYETYNEGKDAIFGIACSDSSFRVSSPDDMVGFVQAQQNISSFSDALYTQLWPCARWKLQAAERYAGNYKAKTNFPILYVNGLADPVTPDESAFNASAGFEGSVVLRHGGYGHGFYSDPSLDVARAIRAYFLDGILPAKDTFYEADFAPFNIPNLQSVINGTYFNGLKKRDGGSYSGDDKELLKAMAGISDYQQRKSGSLGFPSWS